MSLLIYTRIYHSRLWYNLLISISFLYTFAGCLLQSAGGESNRILLAYALSSMLIICPNTNVIFMILCTVLFLCCDVLYYVAC